MIRNSKHSLFVLALFAGLGSLFAMPNAADNPGMRYATDAYPGFDDDYKEWRPEKKEPRFFSFWYGVDRTNSVEQLEFARQCAAAGSDSKARRAFDALVRQWPFSAEAPVAQQELANLVLTRFEEYDNAFDEFRYLLDFYPSRCDYHAVCAKMYEIANAMRAEGKTLMWFRFSNVTEVRHRFESLIVRSPGEDFVRSALLTVAELREEELRYEEAVQVFENLRNHYPESDEALESYYLESRARIGLLRAFGYNRNRVLDSISFFGMAENVRLSDEKSAEITEWKNEALRLVEDEAFRAAQFYDSRTRTKRSAISAYERFLAEYPDSPRAAEARARIENLKGE